MSDNQLPDELLWLLDAPMFIDEKQVDAFYDAVVRPDYEGTSVTLSETITRETTFRGGARLGALLPWWLVKAEGEVELEHQRGRERGQERTLRPVSNAYRHLLAVALHYAGNQTTRGRVLLADTKAQTAKTAAGEDLGVSVWRDAKYVTDLPRALVFLDLAQARLIPTALELNNGEVVLLFDTFAAELTTASEPVPEYPGSDAPPEQRDTYWGWFASKFNEEGGADRKALRAVEDAVKDHRIAWIDYRVPLGKDGGPPFLHLHLQARGEFDTGVFAYNLISRGLKHGVRIVGTLKSEPNLNVLAIFER
jgi:hypothetical protein